LKWTRQCCLKHEQNRQLLIEFEIAPLMTKQFSCGSPLVVRQVCAVMRSLIMDDDIRVPFGKAHDHARLIASECGALKSITSLLHGNICLFQTVIFLTHCSLLLIRLQGRSGDRETAFKNVGCLGCTRGVLQRSRGGWRPDRAPGNDAHLSR
jgi:hypothetical protein